VYYGNGRIVGLALLAIIGGAGLLVNSLRGLASREQMYDAESTAQMRSAGFIGILAGAALALGGGYVLLAWGVRLFE
jgi:hypothetical protein